MSKRVEKNADKYHREKEEPQENTGSGPRKSILSKVLAIVIPALLTVVFLPLIYGYAEISRLGSNKPMFAKVQLRYCSQDVLFDMFNDPSIKIISQSILYYAKSYDLRNSLFGFYRFELLNGDGADELTIEHYGITHPVHAGLEEDFWGHRENERVDFADLEIGTVKKGEVWYFPYCITRELTTDELKNITVELIENIDLRYQEEVIERFSYYPISTRQFPGFLRTMLFKISEDFERPTTLFFNSTDLSSIPSVVYVPSDKELPLESFQFGIGGPLFWTDFL